MKTLIAVIAALSSMASYAQSRNEFVIDLKKVDVLLSNSNGYVSPKEILAKDILLSGTRIQNGKVILDLTNPKLDVSSIILHSGVVRDVVSASGGDMGGGGKN
jgi:hypothetical protein